MLISELINELKNIQIDHGDLEVFDYEYYSVVSACLFDSQEEGEEFDPSWNMPDLFVRLHANK